ncbi:MAG: hypothetical protein UW68_C0012G0016 [Candidatus Collierbacteria bacterium GW2011_GWB1_44_6]|uniref:Ribonuclease VapC n=2 Tax=Candidatus Collieribacteriota TaxID=1752725 RepID=A0A0G1JPR4_9BACT|nr:MAG: hypothetical protein UV68_C0027G0011 [Candidatus Collierbacteria bacterium GW2011_GWC2_43_12]KKT73323.1 MAG: hypothetical protein UW68_C0012G0016 [Candidatus Collierbacteria bacterium GW2011_GWB1_44_6]KKT82670.1 MAG: hypothetical protein UW80_C0033G0015 [Microgenomates group bacterium GW2011_GWC1_44_9]
MNSVVLDTSVVIKWLNQSSEENIDKADEIMEAALRGKIKLFAPELARYECGNVLLKGKKMNPSEAQIVLGTAYALPITFISESEDMAKETFEIAFGMGITYYDAAFLCLAKKIDATLVTENIKHQAESKGIKVVSLSEYIVVS